MYRILIASNGYYYVQHYNGQWWKKTGGFFSSRGAARTFIRDMKRNIARPCCPTFAGRVLEYV